MRIATGRPVGPINAVNGSNDAHSGIHIPYIFHPKTWKISLRPMANSKSYNSGIVEDTSTLFSPNWGFSGSANQTVLLIDQNLAWEMSPIVAPNGGLYRRRRNVHKFLVWWRSPSSDWSLRQSCVTLVSCAWAPFRCSTELFPSK